MSYNNISELFNMAEERDVPLSQIILETESALTECSYDDIYKEMERRYEVMKSSAKNALFEARKTAGGLIEGITKTHYDYTVKGDTLSGDFINKVMARALSCSEVNASMGKICAVPTAGSCGIIPAVIISLEEALNLSKKDVLDGLLCASGIGAVITRNATVSGAEGGCQAECGVAAAMAAAAAVQMKGGTRSQCVEAVSIALMNVMGLVCDPVAGLVQVPCAQRNASQAVNAIISADMALAGMKSIIPVDQIIEAMYKVGKMLPMELKETAKGGIAHTPAGKAIFREIFGK
ncbi:L-serine ammonia-lyase, iron-sulfur-dependent, subunit alpha [Tyzzerella sp. An114]|uniref:L-serine ammonia-lyase, iron-sulfur-dependent, subunit alpha n=1 Tax=Tyzzerella sp. An114 TaxID=1965545 RepID=UPI000B44E900|nr:L-serine ammonia-lyase, iron-sulfur-dependent, subunit alpha [Tyzzerella sp. An114]OUQ57406.1 L-serine ammonia-lyase, iron-sulfur-dependent, subunit alpha [Tyzzerella sp. An114]